MKNKIPLKISFLRISFLGVVLQYCIVIFSIWIFLVSESLIVYTYRLGHFISIE